MSKLDKLTLSDISEKLLSKRIPPEILDEIYLYLDYSTLSELNLTNEQWHSVCKKYFIVPFDNTKNYHNLFLWWFEKTKKPFKIIDTYNYYEYHLEEHSDNIYIEGYMLISYVRKINREQIKQNNRKKNWSVNPVSYVLTIISIPCYFPFQAYKNVSDIHKGAIKYEHESTDEIREELKVETKTTHYILLKDNNILIKCEVYISYFHINYMRIKVIRTLVYNLPLDRDIRLVSNIFPYQLGEEYILPSNINNQSTVAFYVPSMTTMDYYPELKYIEAGSVVHQNNSMFVQLRDILHKEITDRTLMFGQRW